MTRMTTPGLGKEQRRRVPARSGADQSQSPSTMVDPVQAGFAELPSAETGVPEPSR